MAVGSTKVVQVTNIAPQATKDQMHILFGYLGKIEDIRLYPTIRDVSCPVQSRICYIKFVDVATVGIAQHMTNTVFIDRALIVIPISSGEIPDEYYALEMTRNGTIVPGLSLNEPKLPQHVVNSVQGSGADQVIITTDHNLDTNNLPSYPPLPSTYDTAKIEETRRTILMLNVDPSATNDEIINFFSAAGEIKYLRTCTSDSDNASHMLIEFTDQSSIINALKMNGMLFKGNPVEIQHATQPIIKPQAKSNEAAQREIEEAMSRFKEAQNMINASIEPVIGVEEDDLALDHGLPGGGPGLEDADPHHVLKDQSLVIADVGQNHVQEDGRSSSRKRGHRSRDRSSRAKSRDRDRRSRDKSRDRKRSRDRDRKSRDRDSKEKAKESKSSRDSKEKRSDKESSVDVPEKKRSRTRSKSRRRSKSRDRKPKDRKRSRSRGSRRRTPSPRPSRKRSRSRSKDRKRDKKNDKRDKDRKERSDRKSRSGSRSTRSHSKVPRNYDEEEKGFDTDKDKSKDRESDMQVEKESSEKSDNMDISNSP
ncbi:hypothetical protein NQ315_007124 [Exocentrus adspersus]|uniref:RRM domain-containing protein n=1 Tax=Exocentrus adspersus TaxID=1586481 RepID=A0AAV8WCT6_9CUCU|nr:hypothetical protein NQ315_007124 [Exocentrus adspersus]